MANAPTSKMFDECDGNGQICHVPSLRACQRCTENGLQCIRRAMMVFTMDCEEGNKQAMLQIKESIQEDRFQKI